MIAEISDDQTPSPKDTVMDSVRGNDGETRAKKISCDLCRKRKLKCDGNRSGCSNCFKVSRACFFNEVRRKSGPKRGYVKTLEARIAQMESKLKSANAASDGDSGTKGDMTIQNISSPVPLRPSRGAPHEMTEFIPQIQSSLENTLPPIVEFPDTMLLDQNFVGSDLSLNGTTPADNLSPSFDQLPPPSSDNSMIALGLEEAMPDRDVTDDLNRLFFERIHPTMPILHQSRFIASMNHTPSQRPPVCLLYAMWALAAYATDGYEEIHNHFYQRARKYAERDEMDDDTAGFGIATVAHCQAWTFISAYEFRKAMFPRAWLSIGRSARIATMLCLHKTRSRQPVTPSDWIEQEERRRTFWMCYCHDRYASSGPGWPAALRDENISISLPCADDLYNSGLASDTPMLEDAVRPGVAAKLAPFAGVVVTAYFLGRGALLAENVQRSLEAQRLDGNVWRQHRALDKAILDFSMSLSGNMRLPNGVDDANVVLLIVTLHAATVALHKSAVVRAEVNDVPASLSGQSKMRCIAAAQEITSCIKILAARDLRTLSPFVLPSLMVSAGVFVQYLRARPGDEQARDNLDLVVSFMQSLGNNRHLAGAFLVQLEADLMSAGIEAPEHLRDRRGIKQVRVPKARLIDLCPRHGADAGVLSTGYDLFGPSKFGSRMNDPAPVAASGIPVRTRSDDGNPGGIRRVGRLDSREDVSSSSGPGDQIYADLLHTASSRVSTVSSATPPTSINGFDNHSSPKGIDEVNVSSGVAKDGEQMSGPSEVAPGSRDFKMGMATSGFASADEMLSSNQLLNSMTDADWWKMMDVSMQDMGWNNGMMTG